MSDKPTPKRQRATGRQRPSSRPAPAATVQPARRVAYGVISAVSRDDAYANLLLPTAISRAALNTADAGLATELTYGTLRLRGYYDRVLELAAGRPVGEIDPPVLDVLRLGAHQLLGMRVASHAAVNESVSLAREVGSRSVSGFVNGVLRTLSRSEPAEWKRRVLEQGTNDDDRLSTEYAHPAWIVRAFRQSLTAEGRGSELESLLAADNVAPRVNLVALPGLVPLPADAHPNDYAPTGFTVGQGDPEAVIGRAGGALRVQDEGSQLAALALTRFRRVAAGERWLDLCAGPGGKTALLGAEAQRTGAQLDANEITPARAELVRRAVRPLDPAPEVSELDGRDVGALRPRAYDRILVDAPCTGLGALRRRPEARWRKTAKDVAELTVLQAALLESAFDALAPGGTVAYVTCSPHIAETRGIVLTALNRWGADAELLDTVNALNGLTEHPLDLGDTTLGDHGGTVAQLWPHRHGTDAMFIALIRKTDR